MFDCVIPAAGASSRMRSSGGKSAFKPLLPFAAAPAGDSPTGDSPTGDSPTGEMTLVEAAVGAALDGGGRVILVVGYRCGEITSLFDAAAYRLQRDEGRIVTVFNPRWEDGLVGSIQTALGLVRGEAFFVAHADMPFVRPEDYAALAEARMSFSAAPRAEAVDSAFFASWGGRAGHPALIPSAWIPELAVFAPGEKLRPFFDNRSCFLVETGPGALRDIDTLHDYEGAIESCKGEKTM
jgi:CTP:molybdopterin cytidylyltransferase MocA